MKYQRLSLQELNELEKEFIEFLVVNGVEASDWQQIKDDEPEKADAIIDQFSDVIWEASLRKLQYLEKHESSTIYCFYYCAPDEIHLKKVSSAGNGQHSMVATSKNYKKEREAELFEMIQQGCVITKGALYRSLD